MKLYSLKFGIDINNKESLNDLFINYNQSSIKSVTLFFAGWGMDCYPFIPLKIDIYQEIIIVYDYSNIDKDFFLFDGKTILLDQFLNFCKENQQFKISLLSWSMGVMSADYILSKLKIDTDIFLDKIALNGTLKPVSNQFGIPKIIFNKTLSNIIFSIAARNNFNKLMCLNPLTHAKFFKNQPARSGESIIEELKSLGELALIYQKQANIKTFYNKTIIANSDKIIPTRNQLNFWCNYDTVKIIELKNSSHFPFYNNDIFNVF